MGGTSVTADTAAVVARKRRRANLLLEVIFASTGPAPARAIRSTKRSPPTCPKNIHKALTILTFVRSLDF
jgi:hypothetical protein